MRTYTLAFSIVAHLVGVAALVVVPLVANDVLPDPRIAIPYMHVVPAPLPPPPAVARNTREMQSRPNPDLPPVDAPTGIRPENAIEHDVLSFDRRDGFEGGVCGCIYGGVQTSRDDWVPPPPPTPPAPTKPVRVGGSIQRPQKIRDVTPVYPALALAARKEGIVILEAIIGEDGRVRSLTVLRSIPLLDQAAIDAVRQWVFTPTLLNGQPVPVAMTVTVAFNLTQ